MEYKTTQKITKPVINEILDVKNTQGLTAKALVERAKDKKSPLHDLFEWNNKLCGHRWREQQARVLINEVKIKIDSKEIYAFENVEIYVENKEEGEIKEKQYKQYSEIIDDEVLRKQIILRAYKQLAYWKEKYSIYSEFSEIIESIESFETKINQHKEIESSIPIEN